MSLTSYRAAPPRVTKSAALLMTCALPDKQGRSFRSGREGSYSTIKTPGNPQPEISIASGGDRPHSRPIRAICRRERQPPASADRPFLGEMLQTQRIDRQTRMIEGLRDEVRRRLPSPRRKAGSFHVRTVAFNAMVRPRSFGGSNRLGPVLVAMLHRPS